jgi:superfamily II DNA or RNA helicase
MWADSESWRTELSLRDLNVNASYDTGDSSVDVVGDFFEPCLDEAYEYNRLSGYFSSRVLALAARGLGGFLQSNGKMRLITSAHLSSADFDAIHGLDVNPQKADLVDLLFSKALNDRLELESLIEKNHLEAMCWLLREGRLEIKVVIPNKIDGAGQAIFHSKVGIFRDSVGNAISFSGSMNETLFGWTQNIEEFKVFKSWDEATSGYVQHDEDMFERYWNPPEGSLFTSMNLPEATRNELISIAPPDAPHLTTYTRRKKAATNQAALRDYQLEAIDAWEAANYKGILAMATGTGKTKTAAACIRRVQSKEGTLTVVTAPYQHIAIQWIKELEDMAPILVIGGTDWEPEIRKQISNIKLARQKHIVLVVVQNTAASQKFRMLCDDAAEVLGQFLVVADEAHGLGAVSFQRALNSKANFRLGLSATPERYFDEVGTEKLISYFGGTCYEFDTKKALTWVDPQTGETPLCPYEYHPIFVELSPDESEAYRKLSERIGKLQHSKDEETLARLEKLLFERAAVLKKASEKLESTAKLIETLGSNTKDCLIYCNDFDQLISVASVLKKKSITFQKITGEEGSSPEKRFGMRSEREWILENFAHGKSQVLLAIKCLDEGVDIPSARVGIILASSGNPREFIQRRGRLMRRFPGKAKASIYDFVVAPSSLPGRPASNQEIEIFRKELLRTDEFAEDALNADEVNRIITKKLGEII